MSDFTPHPHKHLFQVQHPAWAAHASIYEVNVRQYTPEGTFRAFAAHLPRLAEMGVGILWLMPIHPIGELHRKGSLGSQYAVRDYFAVNPEFGTLDDLRYLVQQAHQLNMHVILDWVANHTSWDNALVTEHPEWFTKDENGRMVPPIPDWEDVVDLDYNSQELRRYMTDALRYWVQEADIDGYRCDVAGLVPTDFWDAARQELDQVKPVFMLAEWDELYPSGGQTWETFNGNTHLLERAFDMTFGLRLHYLLDEVAEGKHPLRDIDDYLTAERAKYPPGIYLMHFTSNHDVNSWDGTEYERLGENALPFAVLCALLPGMPMLYSGQEAALNRRLAFFDRDPIAWNDFPLQGFYTTLLQLKKRHPALRNGDPASAFERLPAPDSAYAFVRRREGAAVLVVVNSAPTPLQWAVPDAAVGTYGALFSQQIVTLEPASTLPLAAHGYHVYELLP